MEVEAGRHGVWCKGGRRSCWRTWYLEPRSQLVSAASDTRFPAAAAMVKKGPPRMAMPSQAVLGDGSCTAKER